MADEFDPEAHEDVLARHTHAVIKEGTEKITGTRDEIADVIRQAEEEAAEAERQKVLEEQQRKTAYTQTFSGRRFYPYEPRTSDIAIADIAHALSYQCRYSGHCRQFYSVAQHSVIVSYLVSKPNAFEGLMHDSQEAYVSDVASPIKKVVPEFAVFEQKIWSVIAERFGIKEELCHEVKTVDKLVCKWEYERFLNPMVEEDEYWPPYQWTKNVDFSHDPEPIIDEYMSHGWSPDEAEQRFMTRFHELYAKEHERRGFYGKEAPAT